MVGFRWSAWRKVVILTLGVAAVYSAVAFPANPRPPGSLDIILKAGCFPPRTQYTSDRMPASFEKGLASLGAPGAEAAYYYARINKDKINYYTVSGMVIKLRTPDQAHKVYAVLKSDPEFRGKRSRLAPDPFFHPNTGVGDEGIDLWTPTVSKHQLLIRDKSIVWELEVIGTTFGEHTSKDVFTDRALNQFGKVRFAVSGTPAQKEAVRTSKC
jgi:hypothetical protein